MVTVAKFVTQSSSVGMSAFLWFLPMSFFFVMVGQRGLSYRISALEEAMRRGEESGTGSP